MGFKVAVVGATGAVGRELLSLLEARSFPVSELVPFASQRSLGKPVRLNGKEYPCKVLQNGCFDGVQVAFFDASDEISREWVPQAAASGAWVIDNSATYRLDPEALLIVPEVNGDLLEERVKQLGSAPQGARRVFSGPNCSTVQLVMALKPLRDRWGLKRVSVASYQSTSGAGTAAMDELKHQLRDALDGRPARPEIFSHPIAFNCIPQIGGFKEDGYTSEERKIMEESRKLLALPELRITATAVRVPTLACHGEVVNVECDKSLTLEEVKASFAAQSGVELVDEPSQLRYPMAIDCAGKDPVYVGRVRIDRSVDHGLSFWVVSDNLRKGAALNAIQIGEVLVRTLR